MASPLAIIATIAAVAFVVPLPGRTTGFPIGLLLIVAVELGALVLAREGELGSWQRVWLMLLACTLTLLPVLAIQAALSRVPYTSLATGSAGPVIIATLAAIAMVGCLTGLAGILAAETPEHGGILLAPALLLVPAVLGGRGELDERAALFALAVAWGVGAAVVGVGWLLPRAARPLVGLAAFGLGFVGAWLLGLRADTPPGRGLIVPVLTSVLLIATALCAAAVPVIALTVNRFAQTVRSQSAAAPRSSPRAAGSQRDRPPPSAPRHRR